MSKKIKKLQPHGYSPCISSFNLSNLNPSNYNNITVIRNKTPLLFHRPKNPNYPFISDEDALNNNIIHNNSMNKSFNNQTFIYNSINFNNHQNSCNNLKKQKRIGGNSLLSLNPNLNFKNLNNKKSRSISKNKINTFIDNLFSKQNKSKTKTKSLSKKKININHKLSKKKFCNINNVQNLNANSNHCLYNLVNLNTTGGIIGKNIKKKYIVQNNINKKENISVKKKKIKTSNSSLNSNTNFYLTENEKKILKQIEILIYQLIKNCTINSKIMIIKELEKIFKNALSFGNLNINKANNDFENKLNLLNNKFNKIEEENINIKNILSEKYTAFEDVKNSLKNFQEEINKLKNNTITSNNGESNIKNVQMKNVSLSNIKKVNELEELNNNESRNNYNPKNNVFLNSDRELDPLSITFNNQVPNVNVVEIQHDNFNDEFLSHYDEFSPSWRKASDALMQRRNGNLNK